jgi:hypothetical protein
VDVKCYSNRHSAGAKSYFIKYSAFFYGKYNTSSCVLMEGVGTNEDWKSEIVITLAFSLINITCVFRSALNEEL